MVFLTENRLVAARDPRGWRPLILGQYEGAWIVASETCAFDLIGAEYLREIAPGEVLVIDKDGVRSSMPFPKAEPRLCVFEFVYFARPDSRIFNQDVHAIRQAFGRELAREHPADADLVMAVPDSGLPATIGFGHESGLPFDMGLIRSHYTGRTFIEPTQDIRLFGVRRKLNPNRAVLRGKRVVMVDDSIVRGNTMRKIMTMVREAGAKEIHVRISSPPVTWPCYYGIDTPTREELIGANKTPHEIAEFLGADSLGYLSIDGMKRVLNAHQAQAGHYCYACFNGDYPEPPDTENHRRQMHLFQANEASVEKG